MNDIFISRGNRKVKCSIWSLPSGETCKIGAKCGGFCYAKKAERCYKAVLPRRRENYNVSLRSDFTRLVVSKIRNPINNIVRIHESGDFYSKEYVEKWYEICNYRSGVAFYAYTKRDDIFDKKLIDEKPPNLKLLWSIDGIKNTRREKNAARREAENMIIQGYDKAATIYGSGKHNCLGAAGSNIKCMRNCKLCIDNTTRIITFGLH